jgi:hypothetical protein
MTLMRIAPAPRAAAFLALAILAVALLIGGGTSVANPGAATGSADVRLVRLLSDIPDSMRTRPEGRLHDLRVRLVQGNVLVFRKGGEFAALLPIETIVGNPDSLRYFFYVEKPALFWIYLGAEAQAGF